MLLLPNLQMGIACPETSGEPHCFFLCPFVWKTFKSINHSSWGFHIFFFAKHITIFCFFNIYIRELLTDY